MPFDLMAENWRNGCAAAFETANRHWGMFKSESAQLGMEDLLWLKRCLPIAAQLYQDDRFQRAFSIYDGALFSARKEVVTVLIWTAIEILFDASAEQNKTRAICASVSAWIGHDKADRDRAYNTVRDLYMKRGRIVHVGREIEVNDFLNLMICRAIFGNVLGRDSLPPPRLRVVR